MKTYIVHQGTGTIIDADECVVVKLSDAMLDTMSGDDYFDDTEVLRLAAVVGQPCVTNDLRYDNCVSFSPSAIRGELVGMIDDLEPTDPNRDALEWAFTASDEELMGIADWILSCDSFWDGVALTGWIRDAAVEKYETREK